jgi:DNA-binding CsgD family transcriptional regulator
VEHLSRGDLRAALEFLGSLREARDLDEFAASLVLRLPTVIPSHASAYNEVNISRRRIRWLTDLDTRPEHVAAFEHHMPKHPILNYFRTHPLGHAITISDLVSQAEFRSTGLYGDLYRPLRCERLLAIEVSSAPLLIGVVVFRDRVDFSERDREMLTLLRPHLANAYRNAEMLSDNSGRLALLQEGLDIAGFGAIELRADDSVRAMTATARAWLAAYFDATTLLDRLPEQVQAWLHRNSGPAALPLVVTRGERRVTLRLVRRSGQRLVLLREQRTSLSADDLATLGLARREAEILAWVAVGKTDAEIADILGISPRTVSHTLERIYRKLGVPTRTAAAARALEAAWG